MTLAVHEQYYFIIELNMRRLQLIVMCCIVENQLI